MNNEKEIQEFLSKPPYFQMLSVLTAIQENIPENANESLLKIKKSLQEAICDYNSVLDKIQKQLIFDSDIYNLVFFTRTSVRQVNPDNYFIIRRFFKFACTKRFFIAFKNRKSNVHNGNQHSKNHQLFLFSNKKSKFQKSHTRYNRFNNFTFSRQQDFLREYAGQTI